MTSLRPNLSAATEAKCLSFEKAPLVFRQLRAAGRVIVQCHGTFDLLHPGHIIHFEEARSLGDILGVTITGEQFVNKGPGRPFFNDQLRVCSLAALACVDYVVVVPFAAAVEAIECVCPHIYCKGKEYAEPETDVTGNIRDDVQTVERLGGRVCYVGSMVFSSSKLLNQHFAAYNPSVRAFCRSLADKCPARRVIEMVEAFRALKVLVIGDVIFDRYTTVFVQGLTSKNKILSGRVLVEETQAGGALAIFRHVREFTSNVKLAGIVGTEPWVEQTLGDYIAGGEETLLRVAGFTSIIKQRFVEPRVEGKALSKLFAVNCIDEHHPGPEIIRELHKRLEKLLGDFDLIIVADFGHGLLQQSIRDLVQRKAAWLALNCQTNSNNYGFNLINRQYHRADSFSLDQTEITLASGQRFPDFHQELARLQAQLGARYAWLTRGEVDTLGIKTGEPPCICPPLERNVLDTIGAGDAFCAIASLAAACNLPIDVATFIGQLAGAQAVRIVGNAEPIRKTRLLKGVETMLNY